MLAHINTSCEGKSRAGPGASALSAWAVVPVASVSLLEGTLSIEIRGALMIRSMNLGSPTVWIWLLPVPLTLDRCLIVPISYVVAKVK